MRKYNFPTHISGDTFNGVKFRITKDDVPVDLTSAIIKMYCKSSPNNVYEFSNTAENISILDAADGMFEFKKQIIILPVRIYNYEIEITFPNEDVYTWVKGTWEII